MLNSGAPRHRAAPSRGVPEKALQPMHQARDSEGEEGLGAGGEASDAEQHPLLGRAAMVHAVSAPEFGVDRSHLKHYGTLPHSVRSLGNVFAWQRVRTRKGSQMGERAIDAPRDMVA